MAWNQPTYNKRGKPKPAVSRRYIMTATAVAAIAIATGIAFIVICQGDRNEEIDKNKTVRKALISEAKPETNTAVRVEASEPVATEPKFDPNARPTKPGQKLNGYVMLPNGELHQIRGEVYSNPIREKPKYAVFKYPAENIIAGILAIEPGAMVVGNARDYRGKFIENFNKSLYEPIVINDDDSEYVKEIKESVVAAKQELKAAMDRGEDIEEIIKESRNELQRLATYKQDIRREMLRYLNREATSIEDAESMFEAANKMLEAKGIAPLEDTPLVRIKLKMTQDM